MDAVERAGPYLLSVLRIVAAALFIEHGTAKLFGVPAAPPGQLSTIWSMLGAAALLEVIGGGLLLIGLFTRPVAFVLSGQMAFAYFIAHAPKSFYPAINGGDGAILFCFLFLYMAAVGGGAIGVDAARNRG